MLSFASMRCRCAPPNRAQAPEPRGRRRGGAFLNLLALLALLCLAQPPTLEAAEAGQLLTDALHEFASRGVRLIWSSQLVDARLKLTTAPRGDGIEEQLRSILDPLDLALQPLAAGGWVVVSRPPNTPAAPEQPGSAAAAPPVLSTITVQTSRYDYSRDTELAEYSMDRQRLEQMPGTSEDVARSLQRLPGTAAGDFSARTHVRGSRDDETAFRFDGVALIDPFHLKNFQGLFSAIDPAVTDTVHFYTGDFPIEYGGSIGAVADITPRRPTRLLAEAGVSMLNNSVLLGAPFAHDRASVLISARESNLSRIARILDRDIGEPEFRDLTVRLTWDPLERLSLSAGVLALEDGVDLSTEEPMQLASATYRDVYTWLRGTARLPLGLRWESLLSTASLDAHRSAQVDRPQINQGRLTELRNSSLFTLRQELSGPAGSAANWHAGAEYTHASSLAGVTSQVSHDPPFFPGVQPLGSVQRQLDVHARYTTFAAWVSGRWSPGPNDVLEAGIRRDSQTFQAEDERSQWSTRFNLWHRLSATLALRLAWGQYVQPQALSRLDVADGLDTLDTARRARQASLSLEKDLAGGWQLRIGAYDKHEGTALRSFDNAFSFLVLTPEIEIDRVAYTSTGAHLRGLEFAVQSDRARPLSGWASYVWSKAQERIGGASVDRSWDQPHALQLGAQWRRGPWQLAGTFNWHSGWPFTALRASSTTWIDPATVELSLGGRNAERQRHFRSLDLRLSWETALPRGTLEASLEVRNAFNSDNECCRNFQVLTGADGRSQLVETSRDWLPVTPILGIRWRL